MACARCLLQLQCVRQVGQWSTTSTAPYGSLPRLASFIQPNLLNNTLHQALKHFHGSSACAKRQHTPADFSSEDKTRNKSVVTHVDLFEQVASEARTKATFNKVVDIFIKRDVRRRGHVEFIYAALKKMPEFGVERDLLIYNKLLDVFPKEVFVPRNFIQRMFNHYPRQQECGVQLLEQMENYGIMPNMETKVLLVQIFGQKSHPMRKYQRIMYWFPKFKNVNPFPIPQELPKDPVDLARFSLKRIANDLDAEVTVYQLPCTDITESGEQVTLPHVVGIQSPSQMEQLAQHNPSRPLFVEGPFPLWLKKTCVYYYILRADPSPPDEKENVPYNPERCLDYPLQLDLDFDRDLGDDESFDVEDWEEGPVFGICMTGQGDEATLNQWISGLQQKNPILGQVPTLFSLKAGVKELQKPSDTESGHQHSRAEKRKPNEEEEIAVKEELRKASG